MKSLHQDDAGAVAEGLWKLPEPIPIYEWAAREVDFSRVPAYDTPAHGPYDPDFFPFWKPVMDWYQDDAVREIVIVKNSRAGFSENACLIPLRWTVAESPARTMYLTGDQMSAERFLKERIKRGMRASLQCAKAMRRARETEHEIQFESMDFRVSWPRARQAFKQDGWERLFCDEVDTWPEFAADMARKRCDAYPFYKIVFGSSIDPQRRGRADASPILELYNQTNRCEWTMPDPATERPFTWKLGDGKGEGIRWAPDAKNEDGLWDLQRVRETAHYITPEGTRIDEADRMRIVAQGQAIPTATGAPGRVGMRVVQCMIPFASGSFGEVAAAFLSAKRRGTVALKTYFAEFWAELYVAEREDVDEGALAHRSRDYPRGVLYWAAATADGKEPAKDEDQAAQVCILTADVHKDWFQWIVRQWKEPGMSALIDYGTATDFGQLEVQAEKYNVYRVFIDNHYANRRMEVLDYCAQCAAVALLGDEHITMPYRRQDVDPYEGKRGAGRTSVQQYTWNVHEFRSRLLAGMRGESPLLWAIFNGVDRDYIRQVTSTELKDGIWQTKTGQSQDHIFDCEVMQFVAAAIMNIAR